MNQASNSQATRVTGFDAARGSAMLLVFVSHFLDEYALAQRSEPGGVVDFVAAMCRIATPTFFLMSGLILGYLYRSMGDRFWHLRAHLVDKALFLLAIGHPIIAIANTSKSSFSQSMSVGYVTDTLAFCVISSLILMPYLRAVTRLWCGGALYLISWMGWYFWNADNAILEVLRSIFLGPQKDGTIIFYFPLLPWLGIHLIGGFLGEQYSQYKIGELYAQVSRRFAMLGCAALLLVLLVRASYEMVLSAQLVLPSETLYQFFSAYQKFPPGPTYLLFFGGFALLALSGLLWVKQVQWCHAYMRCLEAVGRNSLAAFLLQYFVYYMLLHWLVTTTGIMTPFAIWMYLPFSVAGLLTLILWLDKHGVQRLWTVGLLAGLKRWPALARSPFYPVADLPKL